MKYTLEPESPWPRRYSTCVGNRMTTIQIAVLQQALEALEAFLSDELRPYEAAKTSAAIKAVLAQTEPGQPAAESTYHPCTFILIEGLKKLKAWDVLAEWDKAREIVDKRFHAALAQQDEPVQEPVAWEDALKDAFFEGFASVATYNDTILNSPEEAWEKYKPPHVVERAHGIGETK